MVNLQQFYNFCSTLDQLGKELTKKAQNVTAASFETLALDIFQYQAANNALYAQYLQLLGIQPAAITSLNAIPFLPIQFFKNYLIQTGNWSPAVIFTSSGTTGQTPSQHLVRDLSIYLTNTRRNFEFFYGDLSKYCILALLPSYLERKGSSLVAMADYFIRQSNYSESGFFLYDYERLIQTLEYCKKHHIPTLLLGVSFALLNLAEQYELDLSDPVIIMETGGFKNKKEKEIIRTQLHTYLCEKFNAKTIHSEYGMTELLSQAYAKKDGFFFPAPAMKFFSRQITDPLTPERPGKTGIIAIMDLMNVHSISFILTEDIGRVYEDGSADINGRLHGTDMRGCNLLIQD